MTDLGMQVTGIGMHCPVCDRWIPFEVLLATVNGRIVTRVDVDDAVVDRHLADFHSR